jgi:TRAP-type mannitol/chloroaromatic compound transport system permease small subunit
MPEQHLTGNAVLDTVIRIFDRVTALMSMVGTFGILFIMVLIAADVFGRVVLAAPIPGVPEIVAMSILSIVFLQIANTLMRGKMTRADGFLQLVQRRLPRGGIVLDALMHVAGAVLLGILVNAFYPLFMRSYERMETVGTVGHFVAPIWPTYLAVLIGATALCLAFALRAVALTYQALHLETGETQR